MSVPYRTFGDVCKEMHQRRANTLTQVNAKVPVGLIKISDEMRKLMFMVKHSILDIDRDYTVEEVMFHWNGVKDLPQYKRMAEQLFRHGEPNDLDEDSV